MVNLNGFIAVNISIKNFCFRDNWYQLYIIRVKKYVDFERHMQGIVRNTNSRKCRKIRIYRLIRGYMKTEQRPFFLPKPSCNRLHHHARKYEGLLWRCTQTRKDSGFGAQQSRDFVQGSTKRLAFSAGKIQYFHSNLTKP